MSYGLNRLSGVNPLSTASDLLNSRKLIPYIFLLPFLTIFFVFYAIPIAWAIWLSLNEVARVNTYVGLSHYQTILSGQGAFYESLIITIVIALFAIPLQVMLSLFLAILIDSGYAKLGNVGRTSFLLPMVVSTTVIAMILNLLLSTNGIVNLLLDSLFNTTLPWLTDSLWAKISIALGQTYKWLGFFVIIYLAGLQNIPTDLYDSAKIDGANRIQQAWHITIPQLRPISILVLMLATTRSIKMFDMPFVLTNGGPGLSTRTIMILIYNQAFANSNLGYASALGIIFAILLGGLLYVQHEYGEVK